MFMGNGLDGEAIPIMLCLRCYQEAFSKESWTKLLGAHPQNARSDDSSDACFDEEFSYTIQGLGGKKHPRRRGPILRLKIPINDLLDSEPCSLCQILKDLDTEQHLATDRYERAQADLQLFFPDRSNGTFLPFIIQVTLRFLCAMERDWENSTLLAVTPCRCRLLLVAKDDDTLTSPSQRS